MRVFALLKRYFIRKNSIDDYSEDCASRLSSSLDIDTPSWKDSNNQLEASLNAVHGDPTLWLEI